MSDGLNVLTEMESLSDASPLDLSHQQVAQVRTLLSSSLFHFAWFIFGFRDLNAKLHGTISALLSQWGQPGWERLMVQQPRGSFKTSLCTIANAFWQITRFPDDPVVIVSEKHENVEMWVRTIREVVMSSRLVHILYHDLMPPGVAFDDTRSMPRWWKWTDSELMFQRNRIQPEASISALGCGAAAAGRHWPKMIKDDIISEDAANSPNVMQRAIDWFDKSLYLERPALQGWDLIACTPWAYDDVYAHALRRYNYKLYKRAALENAEGEPDLLGESIFPEKLSTEFLLDHYKKDDFGFQSQMQCEPKAGRDVSFAHEWDRFGFVDWTTNPDRPAFLINPEHFDPTLVGDLTLSDERPPQRVPLSLLSKAILFDPAPSEESDRRKDRNARNALVVAAIDPWGRRFVLDVWAGRLDPMDVILQIFKLADKWGTDRLAVEEVIFSKLYRHWIGREALARNIHLNVRRLKPGKRDKDTRIRSKIPSLKSGLTYFNTTGTEELLKEKLEYPYGRTVDCLDAWAYDSDVLSRPESPGEAEVRMVRQNPIIGRTRPGRRYSATGY